MTYPGDIFNSYIGVGKVHARASGATTARRVVGNCSELMLKINLDTQRQRDYTRVGGGSLQRVDRIASLEASMTLLSFSLDNWKLALAGTSTHVATGTVTGEAVVGYKDSLVTLANPPSAISAVKKGGTTFVAGTDYDISPAGFWVYGTGAIADADALTVDYTKAVHDTIEAATTTTSTLELLFEGLNEAVSNKPVVVEFWRMVTPPAQEIALISDKFGEFKFPGELLKDPSKGSGVSAYARVRYVN